MFDEPDRPQGIFAPEQRRFLLGELDEQLSPEAARQRRYRIRQRVKSVVEDFSLLPLLSEEDVDPIFNDVSDTPAGYNHQDAPYDQAISALLSFLYRTLGDDVFQNAVESTVEVQVLDKLIYEKRMHADVSADIDVSVTNEATEDELKSRFDEGQVLGFVELYTLAVWGRISPAEANERSPEGTPTFPEREGKQDAHGDE